MDLLESILEITMQEADTCWLTPEYADIIKNQDTIRYVCMYVCVWDSVCVCETVCVCVCVYVFIYFLSLYNSCRSVCSLSLYYRDLTNVYFHTNCVEGIFVVKSFLFFLINDYFKV